MLPPLSYYNGGSPYPPNPKVPPREPDQLYSSVPYKKLHPNGTRAPVVRPPATPNPQASRHGSRQVRPLKVNEALPYSPFSSIVPHDSSIITLPNSRITISYPIFSHPGERRAAQQHIEYLDRQARNGKPDEVREALGSVQSLLDPMNVSEFKFKSIVQSTDDLPLSTKPLNAISPFASMVLKHIDIAFTQAAPSTTSSSRPPSKSDDQERPITPVTPVSPSPVEKNQESYDENAVIVLKPAPKLPTPKKLLQPAVVISTPQLSSKPSEYKSYDSASTVVNPRKRKHVEDQAVETNDQRAVANSSLQTLKEFLWEIFEAEDNFEGGANGSVNEPLLISVHGSDGDFVTLSSSAQSRLESCLQKVILAKRFDAIQVEDISRVQKLSDGGLVSADGLDGRIESGWSEDEISSWLDNVEVLEGAFRSARTILRTMTGGREEKLVYPEERLQRVISLLCRVTDFCLTKVVEARSTAESENVFRIASAHKKIVSHLLHSASKVMHLLLDIISKEALSEKPINDILFFVIRMLFVENSPSEKDSVLGIHKFEAFRRTAMNIISMIYSRHEDQREFIIREVLESLQKLPTLKAHGRQFKLSDGKRLQLTTVLLIRLVSTSGTGGISTLKKRSRRLLPDLDESPAVNGLADEVDDSQASDQESSGEEETPLAAAAAKKKSAVERCRSLVKALYESASSNAQRIINFLVHRASSCSKTGEQPHRHLLDMLVEDLVTVFNLPDWPASEMLLRALVGRMIDIAESPNSSAPARNMALETLGAMGTAILDTMSNAKSISRSLETDNSRLSGKLISQLDSNGNNIEAWDLAGPTGYYEMVLEHLLEADSDSQGYHLTQWVKLIFWEYNATGVPPQSLEGTHATFAGRVCEAVANGKWSSSGNGLAISQMQCKLAYQLILLNVGVCKAFSKIVSILINSVKSDQVTVRARGLKSVTQILEKDPSVLDRMSKQVNSLILRCVGDQSSMVRDNALALLGKCLNFRSTVDPDMLRSILICTRDSATGIKKRAIKLLKDIYLREQDKTGSNLQDFKAVISESLLQKSVDVDEGSAELARQTLEDIWVAPFWMAVKAVDISIQNEVALRNHVRLITRSVERSESNTLVLKKFLRFTMSSKSKSADNNSKVYRALIVAGFDSIIDVDTEGPSERSILQTLTIFAQANAKLFTQQQLQQLQPYVGNLSSADDLNAFRRVVVILRCVLPTLPAIQKEFLRNIQDDLLKNVTKLAKSELNEVAACLWTINASLSNPERLMSIELGVLNNLHKMEEVKFDAIEDPKGMSSKVQRLMHLAGNLGHHCDFQPQFETFKAKLPWLRDDTVPRKIVTALKPFSRDTQPLPLRIVALENIGMVCEAWPQNFNDPENVRMFQQTLQNGQLDLVKIALTCFKHFFASQDPQFAIDEEADGKAGLVDGKIGGSVVASQRDSAAALIAQSFVKDILKISLGSEDEYALTATEVLASIVRQGLVHPRTCGAALVALSTSNNTKIAEIALQQHQTLHLQHESMFEREYMSALNEAYRYQKTVANDSRGFAKDTHKAKLHSMYEVIKTSKSKVQTKFFTNYCAKIDFDLAKLDTSGSMPAQLEFARFLIENLALFDYSRMEDLLQVISTAEKIVGSTGAAVAHAINTEVFKMIIDPDTGVPMTIMVDQGSIDIDIPEARCRLLTTASMILSMLWQARTFLRRLYNINNKENRHQGRGRPSKDQNKLPPKNNSVTGDKFTDVIDKISLALDSRDLSLQQCKEFADLMSIDSELKVPADDDDDGEAGLGTPTYDDGDDIMIDINGSGKKRRNSGSQNGTPQKKKRGRPSKVRRKSVDGEDDWD